VTNLQSSSAHYYSALRREQSRRQAGKNKLA